MPFRQKSKEKGKNPFEASMPLDKPEVKMVEARYNEKPFIIAFGIAKKRDVKGGGGIGTTGVKGEYESQKDLEWQVLYNLKALPEGFMPEEKLKEWMAGTVAVTSGSIDVFSPESLEILELLKNLVICLNVNASESLAKWLLIFIGVCHIKEHLL